MKRETYFIFTILTAFMFCSCNKSSDKDVAGHDSRIVEVTARDFTFVVIDEIPSGWSTFRFKNSGHAEHFFLLNLLPDNISFGTYYSQVTKPFDVVFDSLKAGMTKADAGAMLGEMIPSWYFTSVKSMGGTGIVAAGKTAQTTLKLEPGTYAMECYIKEKGVFHTALGMIRPITVMEKASTMEPPKANMDITLRNYKFETEGEIKLGTNTIAVHFEEHPEIGLGNDVHLVRLNDSTDIEEVIYWLDWMNIEGLQSPAPVEFLGGTQEMPVGFTSYFTVDLKPGNYAWIAESSSAKGMVKLFKIE